MDLVDQLNSLKGRTQSPHRRGEPQIQSAGKAPDPTELVERLAGAELRGGAQGRLVHRRVSRRFPFAKGAAASLLTRALQRPIDLDRALFLDTETTGLAGGTGTVAFLVGLAHLDDDRLIVEQAFMPDYPDEAALLRWTAEQLDRHQALVSFNGKTFDMPLLRTRWRLQGSREDHSLPHLDLLPVTRRLFGHRLRGCGLSNVERHVLMKKRTGDLPGRAAPRAFFRYLEGHEVNTMAAVFLHNEADLISTAELLMRVADFYAEPQTRGFHEQADWLGLGEWAEHLGDLERAREVITLALTTLGESPLRTKVELKLAELCRRTGGADQALALWRTLAERDPMAGWPAVRELVRWHEAQESWGQAYAVLETAWARFEQARELRSQRGEWRLPTAWRQWMAECERLRLRLRQAAQEEQLILPL